MMRYDLDAARKVVETIARVTPVLPAPGLSEIVGSSVTLKLENLQVTGSFKVRGAAFKLASLSDAEKERGVVTCSSGNHGLAVSHVAGRLGVPCTVYVPEWCDPSKAAMIEANGARLLIKGATFDEAESMALDLVARQGLTYVSAFDDPFVVAGQSTIGSEILEQVPAVDTVVAPLSGGGLLGGISLSVLRDRPSVKMVAVSALNASVMYQSLEAGTPLDLPETETLASALAGGIGQPNEHTFQLIESNVERHVLVSEGAIKDAMVYSLTDLKIVVEGGGAVGIAASLTGELKNAGEHIVIVVSGGNIDIKALKMLLL
jgi:threonine dehydratase